MSLPPWHGTLNPNTLLSCAFELALNHAVFKRPHIQLPTLLHTPTWPSPSNRIPSPSPSSLKDQVRPLDLMSTPELALQQVLDDHSHLDLTPDVIKKESTQVGGGGFSDVFRSKMRRGWHPRSDPCIQDLLILDWIEYSSTGDTKRRRIGKKAIYMVVAVKRLRFWDKQVSKVEKAIAKEIKIWAGLSHRNVLPILGYILNWTGSTYPSLISPWMENGTLRNYMKQNEVDVSVTAAGIASGLEYLHSRNVVHADLKCDNVLLSSTLRPLLTDFGLSRQLIASVSTSITASGGTLRWKAPELIRNGEGKANEQSDIWAFGMTLLELLTKNVPYSGMNDGRVARSLVNGILPALPDDLTRRSLLDRRLWSLCQDCWTTDPSMRPTATAVQRRINQAYPLELVTNFGQIADLYPHLNLTHVVDYSDFHWHIPLSHLTSPAYQNHTQDFHLRDLWDELEPENVPEKASEARVNVYLSSQWLWPRPKSRKPSIIARGIATLAELSHPNLLPFLGYYLDLGSENVPSSVFLLPYKNQTLCYYMELKAIDILLMAEGIASGLSYLHSRDVVCSGLNSFTVKLSPTLRPLLNVWGFWLPEPDSGIPQEEHQTFFKFWSNWMAVEIFDERHIGIATKETNVWAFGMTILEMFTKEFPYRNSTPKEVVIENLKHHRLPPPPDDIADHPQAEQELWTLVQECWNFEPSERPTAQHLHERIRGIRMMRDFPSDPSNADATQ